MTDTKLEPELPNLPPYDYFVELANGDEYGCWMGQTLRAYALSAIEADRNKRAPAGSDDDILKHLSKYWEHQWHDGDQYMVRISREQLVAGVRALLSSVAPRVPEGFVLVPKEQIERALDVVQDTMQAAYQNGYQVCCGRMGEECCGAPDTDWSPADHRIMDALSPAQRELSALLAAAPQPTQEG